MLLHRHRRTRRAARPVSRRGGRRPHRPRRFRRRRFHQPAAPGPFGTDRRGPPEVEAAKERLRDLNPDIQIDTYETRLTSENALDIFGDYDIIVDGTDNFPTRYLVNDACVLLGKPNVYGSIFRFEGQASVFGDPDGPCYRCLYPEPPPPGLVPSCAEGGVLGVLPGNRRRRFRRRRRSSSSSASASRSSAACCSSTRWRMRFRELKLRKNPDCPICGTHPHHHQADRLRGVLRHSR